jgi:hypothetical protein
MSNPHNLSDTEIATLVALAEACNFSLHAHPPEGLIMKKLPSIIRNSGDGRRALRRLHAMGLCHKHPTRGDTTYNLTREGLTIAQTIVGSGNL